ncbi:MAG: hypothetical protein R3C44_13845 [Chloroflexota bacterium]
MSVLSRLTTCSGMCRKGTEHTLNVYFLPTGGETWQRLETRRFVENMVVADLQEQDGVYAIMATIQMPALSPGWNQFVYPLSDPRPITDALRSIDGLIQLSTREQQSGRYAGCNPNECGYAGVWECVLDLIDGDEPVAPPGPHRNGHRTDMCREVDAGSADISLWEQLLPKGKERLLNGTCVR